MGMRLRKIHKGHAAQENSDSYLCYVLHVNVAIGSFSSKLNEFF